MRIVITTANFFAHDWESIENVRGSVYFLDPESLLTWSSEAWRRRLSGFRTSSHALPQASRDPTLASSGSRFSRQVLSLCVVCWNQLLTDLGSQALGVPKSFAQVRASLEDDPRQLAKVPFTSLNEIADRWDFSTVTVKLIASLAGKREGWDELDSSGIGRLGKVLREEGWIAPAGKELTALEAQVRCPAASRHTNSR